MRAKRRPLLNITYEQTEEGVTERFFDVTEGGERVPAILWTPVNARGRRPLLLMGHGGSQHKAAGRLASLAKR